MAPQNRQRRPPAPAHPSRGGPQRRRSALAAAVHGDRAGGLTLAAAAAAALVWANWSGPSYHSVWYRPAPWSAPLGVPLSVQGWVNQALLLGFFALVGLEIRREVKAGELSSRRRAVTPVLAAAGGMAVPALIYTAIVAGGPAAGAWGVPMATDVAFALGALALIGGVSARARVFLMTLAVADDIFSIVILVAVYSHHTRAAWLVGGVAALAALGALWGWGPGSLPGMAGLRAALAVVAWWALLKAGVEAAVVGAAMGAFIPGRRPLHRDGRGQGGPQVRRWVRRLEAAVNVGILPVFALANVGVPLGGGWTANGAAWRILAAVAVARLVGKPLGIFLTTMGVTRLYPDVYQPRIVRRGLLGVGAVASVGFTVPLLIVRTDLGTSSLATAAVVGLLLGSVLGAATSTAILHSGPTRPEELAAAGGRSWSGRRRVG